jgi:hypothetical protein
VHQRNLLLIFSACLYCAGEGSPGQTSGASPHQRASAIFRSSSLLPAYFLRFGESAQDKPLRRLTSPACTSIFQSSSLLLVMHAWVRVSGQTSWRLAPPACASTIFIIIYNAPVMHAGEGLRTKPLAPYSPRQRAPAQSSLILSLAL